MEKIGLQAVLDDDDFHRGIKGYTSALDSAESHTKNVAGKIGGTLKGIGGGILDLGATAAKLTFGVAVAGAAAFTGALVGSVKAAMDAQQTDKQLETVLQSTGGAAGMSKDAITDLANSLSLMTPIEDDAIVAGESMLLTFTNIGSEVFPQATETLLDMATAMNSGATPSAEQLSGQAIQLGKALNDPIAGLTALTRVGVTFTDAQKEQITAMVEAGDVVGAQQMILAELNKEFGNSARAAGETLPGQLSILKNSLGNIAENIGTALLPRLTGIAKTINEKIGDPKTQQVVSDLGKTLGNLMAGKPDLAVMNLYQALKLVVGPDAAGKISAFLLDAIGKFGQVKTKIEDVVSAIRDKLSAPSTAAGLQELKDSLSAFATGNYDLGVTTLHSSLTTLIGSDVADKVALFLLKMEGPVSALREKFGLLKGWLDENGPTIKEALGNVGSALGDLAKGDTVGAINDLHSALYKIVGKDAADAIGVGLLRIDDGVRAIKKGLDENGPAIMESIKLAFSPWADLAKGIADDLPKISLHLADLSAAAKENGPAIQDALLPAFLAIAKSMHDTGVEVSGYTLPRLDEFKGWVGENAPLVQEIWTGLMKNLTGDTRAGTDTMSGDWGKHQSNVDTVTQWFRDEPGRRMDAMMGDIGSIAHIGLLLLSGHWKEAFRTMEQRQRDNTQTMSAEQDAATTMVLAIVDEFKTKLGIQWDVITGLISDAWLKILGGTRAKVTEIRMWLHDAWNLITSRVSEAWKTIKQSMLDPIEDAKKGILGFVEDIKRALMGIGNIHIPMPHITVNWQDVPVLGHIPSGVSVSWYGKGLDAIINQPTLIGVGESGPERVIVQPLGAAPAMPDLSQMWQQQRMTAPATVYNYSTTNNYWNLNANYANTQTETSLRDTVRLLQMGVG